MKIFKTIVLIINIVFATLLILIYFSVHISPETTLAVSLLPLAFVVLLGINLAFVIFWIIFNWKWLFVSLISIFAGLKFVNLVFPILSLFSLNTNDGDFKIMSYNVQIFGWYDWENNLDLKADILKLIEVENPDVLCMQEAYWNKEKRNFVTLDSIQLNIDCEYIYASPMATARGGQKFGLVTISRYPIVNSFSHRFNKSNNGFTYCDILFNEDTVRVYNCHLQSLHLSSDDISVFSKSTSASDNERAIGVLKTYLKSLRTRAKQAEMISASMDSTHYPVFLCGDFNDIPLSYAYFTISKGLKDSFATNGSFPGYTWDNFHIKQRIDYILYSKDYNCTDYKVIKKNLSDHFPITASFKY